MKKFRNALIGAAFLCAIMPQMAYANMPSWEEIASDNQESHILLEGELKSENVTDNTARGIRLSTAILSIENEEDGTLHIIVNTLTHKDVDRIYQTVFLDMWDEDKETWNQIGDWTFDKTKEETEDGKLSSNKVSFLVNGCEPNRYYRARAMHLVQWGDDMEGKATETDGVLLTNK
ncbi:Uncharacterised protein [uncultured Clostridium sp.]|nr:Uncharacterised protein [uncultured Clostridium sp.]